MKNEVNITTSSTEMMTISRVEYESLKAERDELNQKLDWLMEQVRLAKKKVYGTSLRADEGGVGWPAEFHV